MEEPPSKAPLWKRVLDDYLPLAVTEYRLWSILAVVAVALVFAAQLPNLGADFSPQSLFATADRDQQLTNEFEDVFGNTESVISVFVQSDDVFTQGNLQYLHDVSLHLRSQPWAERVESLTLTSFPRSDQPGTLNADPVVEGSVVSEGAASELRTFAPKSTLMRGTLVSESGGLAAAAAQLGSDFVRINEIRDIVDELHAWLSENPPPDGTEAILTGIPELRAAVVNQMFQDQLRLVPISLLISLFFLYICFHWFPAMFVPNVAVLLTITIVMGGMAWAREPFNMVNQILPILVMVIGISDSIHLVNRYGEELRKTGSRREAAREMVRRMAVACFLTSSTTAVGFGSLYIARTQILRGFGVAAACAMLVAYVVTIIVVPALLTMFPAPQAERFMSHDGVLERISIRLVDWVSHHAKVVLVVNGVIIAGALGLATQVTVDSNLLDVFRENHPSLQSLRLAEDEMQGLIPIELSLVSEEEGRFYDPEVLNAVDDIAEWVRQQRDVLATRTFGDYLHEAWAAYSGDDSMRTEPFRTRAQVAQLYSLIESARPDPTTAYVTFDRTRLRLQIQIRDMGGRATLALVEEMIQIVEAELAELDGVSYHVTGDGYAAARGVDFIMRDMLSSLALAFVIIFVIMTMLFRSVRMGLISVPPNIIPLIFTLAYMAARGIYLNSTTAIIFSISLGLAVDDTIHFMARFREEINQGAERDWAIRAAAAGAGRAILVTTIMLASGLMVLLGSSFVPIALFAELIGVTLISCLVGDLIVLPALLKTVWKPRSS